MNVLFLIGSLSMHRANGIEGTLAADVTQRQNDQFQFL